ncbi:MAG: hypothetical protein K0S48_22 [Ramlibacter sp.]|jgi:hypothetical protein|nr:hypothetical protein [Ramlibacter sp.]
MSIANSIREAVMYHHAPLMDDALLNRILSAFMQSGEWFPEYTHALTFALFVAEALDGGTSGVGGTDAA